ncbi:MAG TPA: TetR family transcriptional regulator [Actinomycetota bacterium]|nr:TetR family transcriptional regulator [Actinomycetota bacterium]
MTEAEGLRERKKSRTRSAIHKEAMRLIREHGYAATTVEQVAEAAEVSASTVFRYFPTKEDLVLHDEYDDDFVEAFKAQPPEMSPLAALRASMRQVIGNLTPQQFAEEAERIALSRSVPELRARRLDELVRTLRLIATAVAERSGRRPDDPAVRAFAGAVIGVTVSAMLCGGDDPPAATFEQFDEALALLEAGLPL